MVLYTSEACLTYVPTLSLRAQVFRAILDTGRTASTWSNRSQWCALHIFLLVGRKRSRVTGSRECVLRAA